jgi:hypothetical protein
MSMRAIRTHPVRKAVASKLRSLANQLESRPRVPRRCSAAPLVRLGGRWWQRDEIAGARELDG